MSDLYQYWMSLNEKQRHAFSLDCGLSYKYINTHVIHKRKTPPLQKLKAMAEASRGSLSYHGLCDFFLNEQEGA